MHLIMRAKTLGLSLLLSIALSGCCTTNPCTPVTPDPYESYNRKIFCFNQKVDCYFYRPIAILYKKIVPCPLVKGINNIFNNLNEITTIPNDILQGNLYFTLADTTRFIINSTLGIGGLIDVASCGGLPPHVEDTGLTFAKWGYRCTSYFVLPFLGPCTVRDMFGLPFDYGVFTLYPVVNIYPFLPVLPNSVRYSMLGLYALDRRTQLLDADELLNQSLDPYIFLRDAYLQRRHFLIKTNDDCCNNINIQNENTPIAGSSEKDDIYVADGATGSDIDKDDIYVPAGDTSTATAIDKDDIYVPADETTVKADKKKTTAKNDADKDDIYVLADADAKEGKK